MRRIILLLILLLAFVVPIAAQEESSNVNFSGVIESIDGTDLIVNGFTVDVSNLPPELVADLAVEMTVDVSGVLSGNIIVADSVTESEESSPDTVIVIIEGPVEAIEDNTVVIFGINIEVEEDDLRLTVIQIGDILRVQGEMNEDEDEGEHHLTIVAVLFIFVDVDVFVFELEVWRDPGSCFNAPPMWAPAWGWHRRCDPPTDGGGSRRRGSRRGGS